MRLNKRRLTLWQLPPWRALLLRFFVYLGLWWVITEGNGNLWLGILTALLVAPFAPLNVATWPQHLRWWRLPRFIGFILKSSLLGALDVARLALAYRYCANTHTQRYRFRQLTHPSQQLLMANLVNLTPGTLTLQCDDDMLSIHILHHHPKVEAHLKDLERHIAVLYGLDAQRIQPPESHASNKSS